MPWCDSTRMAVGAGRGASKVKSTRAVPSAVTSSTIVKDVPSIVRVVEQA